MQRGGQWCFRTRIRHDTISQKKLCCGKNRVFYMWFLGLWFLWLDIPLNTFPTLDWEEGGGKLCFRSECLRWPIWQISSGLFAYRWVVSSTKPPSLLLVLSGPDVTQRPFEVPVRAVSPLEMKVTGSYANIQGGVETGFLLSSVRAEGGGGGGERKRRRRSWRSQERFLLLLAPLLRALFLPLQKKCVFRHHHHHHTKEALIPLWREKA